jgi:MFS family permease
LSLRDTPSLQDNKARGFLANIAAPLRSGDFLLLFSGQMVSTLGDTFYAVALPWLMLAGGRSPQELGVVLACYGVPRVATLLLGGWLSDLLRPRGVMLLSDIMRALLVGLLAALVFASSPGAPATWQLIAVSILLGGFTGLFLPAYYAITPQILHDDVLQAGNALNSSSIQFAIFLGSALAGLIVSRFSPAIAFTIDALTFIVSSLTLLLMLRGQPTQTASQTPVQMSLPGQQGEPGQAGAPLFDEGATFWQVLRSWRLFQVALLVVVIGNLLFDGLIQVALPTLVRVQFAAGAGGYGSLLASFGLGSLLGGLAAGGAGRVRHRGFVMVTLITLLALEYALLPFLGGLAGAVILIGCAGLTNGVLTVIAFTLLQQQAPRHLMGRLMAVLMIATLGLYPFSVALAGIVSTHAGPLILFPISGTLMLLAALFGLSQKEIRRLS